MATGLVLGAVVRAGTDQDAAFGQFGDGYEEIVDTGKLSALRDADAATKPGGDFGEQRIRGLRTGGARIGEGTRVEPLRTQSKAAQGATSSHR